MDKNPHKFLILILLDHEYLHLLILLKTALELHLKNLKFKNGFGMSLQT